MYCPDFLCDSIVRVIRLRDLIAQRASPGVKLHGVGAAVVDGGMLLVNLLQNSMGRTAGWEAAVLGLVCGVGPLVRHNFALLCEPLWAHRASVWLLARVGPPVRGNVALVAEPP